MCSKEIMIILTEYVNELEKLLGKDFVRAILYGSYARGEEEKSKEQSDIDVMVLVNTKSNSVDFLNIEHKVVDFSFDMNLKYNIILSPIVENIDDYNERVKYINYYENVQNEGIVING